MTMRLTDHYFALPGRPLPEVDESLLLEYVFGSNGTYARGRRPGLEVSMPVSFNLQPVRGLAPVCSYAQWGYPRVPSALVETMLAVSRGACETRPREALFHLSFGDQADCTDHLRCGAGWHLEFPPQREVEGREGDSVIPAGEAGEASRARAVIEVHSHHNMAADFSARDDEDESQGFRVYAVMGEIFGRPRLRARVGLFGHFFQYAAAEFFELCEGLADCNGEGR